MSFSNPGCASEFCEPCQKKGSNTIANVFCESCDEFQCDECSNVHKVFNGMKNHKLLEPSKHTRLLVGLTLCDIHNDEIKFYCEEDDQLCCSTCAFLDHRNCDTVEDIDIYANKASLSTDDLVDSLNDHQNTALLCKSHVKEQVKNLQSQCELVSDRMDALTAKVNELFDTLLQNLVKEGNDVGEEIKSAITDKQKKCSSMHAEIEDILDFVDKLANSRSFENMFVAQHKLAEMYSEFSSRLKDTASNMETYKFEVAFEQKLFDATSKGSESDLAKIQVVVKKKAIQCTVPKALAFENFASIELKKKEDDIDFPFYSGMDFLPDGRLIAVDNKNGKLVIFDRKLEELGEYRLNDKYHDLSAYKEDEIAVIGLGGYDVLIFCVTRLNTIVHIRTIKTTSGCSSICEESDTSFIVGCYKEDQLVKSLNLNGDENYFDLHKWILIEDLHKDFLDKKPFLFAYIRKLNKFVIVDKVKERVHIHNAESKEKVEISDLRLKNPKCSAIGPFDCVFIICNTGYIVQMSHSGRVLSRQDTNLKIPTVMCISKDDTMFAVSSTYSGEGVKKTGYIKLFKFLY